MTCASLRKTLTLLVTLALFGCGAVEPPPSALKDTSGLSEEAFNSLINQVKNLYEHEVRSQGATLRLRPSWDNAEFGAFSAKSADVWLLMVYGGTARAPEATEDAFSLIICHEFGHLLGGEPFLRDGIAAEGQADWFATSSCLSQLWANDANAPRPPSPVDPDLSPAAELSCSMAFDRTEDKLICARKLRASWAAMHMVTARHSALPPAFSTPDAARPSTTILRYPTYQCRLDTMAAGALNQPRPRCWFAG